MLKRVDEEAGDVHDEVVERPVGEHGEGEEDLSYGMIRDMCMYV